MFLLHCVVNRDLRPYNDGGTVYRLDRCETYNSMAVSMSSLLRLMDNSPVWFVILYADSVVKCSTKVVQHIVKVTFVAPITADMCACFETIYIYFLKLMYILSGSYTCIIGTEDVKVESHYCTAYHYWYIRLRWYCLIIGNNDYVYRLIL